MDKVKVSKEWTCEERLKLIAVIFDEPRMKRRLLNPEEMELAHALTLFGGKLLEQNRQKFDQYLEAET